MLARKVDVVVLMAGEGRRLRPLTNDRPKGLLLCEDGLSIFNHLIKSFVSWDWDATIIPVVGHGRPKVMEELDSLSDLAKFDHVCNPFYANTGPLISLWLGLIQSKNDSVVIVNGDTLIKESLVENIVKWTNAPTDVKKPTVSLCVSKASQFYKDDMKVMLDENGQFVKAGKDLNAAKCRLKSAGVISVKDANSKRALKYMVNQLIMKPDTSLKSYYWHNLFNEIKDVFKIDLLEVGLDSWYEVDTSADLKTMV
ncbi:sugar phosphate nucleotidyltransferase [Dethiobacter alkaliphilus]|uniref:Sugar nucleotidyltransferase-like protein n=1 Tax=Dethiobacter alkaliphilus AHT 1 TaxID=555088 RepID=C0GGU0_DETAL|nr:sugar phosphate nucleotidyltransferase [Dethiobacter alkaliphilus]EEG77531.1 sugar nucleotidyltransferase-like protein [Dethiobacter alkaliphilus AHT 1]